MDIEDILNSLQKEKETYIKRKIKEYINNGYTKQKAANKAYQSWKSYIGVKIQDEILKFIEKSLKNTNLKITKDKNLISKNLTPELDMVKRQLVINYGKYMFLPDADIIIYKKCLNHTIKIIAIISVKNSFRERGFETTYWKLKLSESPITSKIKVFLVTPDKDNEISYIISKNNRPKKMRIILEYELDGIYFLKKDFQKTDKAKYFKEFINDIIKIDENEKC